MQNNNPLISVIIPVYNVEKYLQRCIDSVTNQTYKNLEIILVDDGSPDNCPKLCDENAKKDPRIKVIHKPNGGLSSARNAGLEIATGDYISFIDSDDWVDSTMYEEMIQIEKNTPCDFIMYGIKKQELSGEYTNLQFNKSNKNKFYSKKNDIVELFCTLREALSNATELHAAVNKFLKSNFINKDNHIRFNEENYGYEDGVFSTCCFDAATSICVMNKSFYNYAYNETSICHIIDSPEKKKKRAKSRHHLRLQTYYFYKKNGLNMQGFIKYLAFDGICDELLSSGEDNELHKFAETITTPLFLLSKFSNHKKDVIKIILYKLKLLNLFRRINIFKK